MKTVAIKARDTHATLNGDKTVHEFPNGIKIIADDGWALFDITLLADGSIEIRANSVVKHNGVMLDDDLRIVPRAAGAIVIERPVYATTAPEG